MSDSVLIERRSSPTGDEDLRSTAVSDLPLEETSEGDVPTVGSVLDERYEITGVLGQGGMGHVLGARHVVLGQRIAIKVLRREMTRDEEIVERFRREARAASAIGHPGIVAVKDFGTLPSGASYYVMEHVEGVGLADVLEKDGPFSIERAVDVVKQMADALGAAHAAGVVHRDVKPDNVILTSFHGRADHVKVLDFGIAKLDFASRLSGAHRVLGTPAYMSPEQARGQTLDQRCDVYALGVVLYELLTGRAPFEDRRPLEVLRRQIQEPAPSVQLLRPDVPDGIADAIARCLEKSPDARPANMAALVELLAPFVAQRIVPVAPSAPSPGPTRVVPLALAVTLTPVVRSVPSRPTPAVAPPVPRRSNAAVIALGLVLTVVGVAALAAAGGILMRERSDEAASPTLAVAPSAPPVDIASAPVVAPAPMPGVAADPAPTVVASAPVVISTVRPAHSARPAHVAPPGSSAPAVDAVPPVAPTTAPPVEHPTIRVIDPWQ